MLAVVVVGAIALAWAVRGVVAHRQYLFHFHDAAQAILWLVVGGSVVGVYANFVRWVIKARRVVHGMAGLELWIEPEGLTYACAAGVFSAPWTALRAIFFSDVSGLTRRSPELIAEVAGWGGPLAEYEKTGRPCELRIPLDGLGADRATIARAVHEISSGRASVHLG